MLDEKPKRTDDQAEKRVEGNVAADFPRIDCLPEMQAQGFAVVLHHPVEQLSNHPVALELLLREHPRARSGVASTSSVLLASAASTAAQPRSDSSALPSNRDTSAWMISSLPQKWADSAAYVRFSLLLMWRIVRLPMPPSAIKCSATSTISFCLGVNSCFIFCVPSMVILINVS